MESLSHTLHKIHLTIHSIPYSQTGGTYRTKAEITNTVICAALACSKENRVFKLNSEKLGMIPINCIPQTLRVPRIPCL